jgi:hypothetical protein
VKNAAFLKVGWRALLDRGHHGTYSKRQPKVGGRHLTKGSNMRILFKRREPWDIYNFIAYPIGNV